MKCQKAMHVEQSFKPCQIEQKRNCSVSNWGQKIMNQQRFKRWGSGKNDESFSTRSGRDILGCFNFLLQEAHLDGQDGREHEMMQGPVDFQSHIGGRGITMKEIKKFGLVAFWNRLPPGRQLLVVFSTRFGRWGNHQRFSQHFNPHPPQRLGSKRKNS